LKTTATIKSFLIILCTLICIVTNGYSQDGFSLPETISKDKISFKLMNNLVVVPVEVNGTPLTFLLDTGVSTTIMFSLSKVDSLKLNNAKEIRLRGLGEGGSIPALMSSNNSLTIGKVKDENHTVYVIFDKSINLSTRMGIPIHGILGYDFFKNLVVKTDYSSKKITVYKPSKYIPNYCKKHEEFDLIFNNKKPYINVEVAVLDKKEEVTLLIDSGSSDAIWLFDDNDIENTKERAFFDDFLGQGISGVIFGKRSKLSKLKIGSFELKNVKVAYPDKESLENIKFFEERDGSLGGDILKRFTVIIDYSSKKIILKKNRNFKLPFYYNMSGITLKHDGVVMVKEKLDSFSERQNENSEAVNITIASVYEFHLAPKFVVSEIREGSPADLVGIRVGDEIISVNGKEIYKYKLHEVIGLFASKANKKIYLKVKRNGIIYRKKFYLKEML